MSASGNLTGSEIDQFLNRPLERVGLLRLHERLRFSDVRIRLNPETGRYAPIELLDRLRRGLGAALDAVGSNEARGSEPCPWRPACASDLLFRERRLDSGGVVPMPYLLRVDSLGTTPLLTLRLFGIASRWAPSIADGVVASLREMEGRDGVLDREIVFDLLPSPPTRSEAAEVAFVTPVRLRHEGRAILSASALFSSLANRITGLARWSGIESIVDWQGFDAASRGVTARFAGSPAAHDRTRKNSPVMRIEGWSGSVSMNDLDVGLAALLSLGMDTHVGGSPGLGFGRYELDP